MIYALSLRSPRPFSGCQGRFDLRPNFRTGRVAERHDAFHGAGYEVNVRDFACGIEANDVSSLHRHRADMRAEFEHGAISARKLALILKILEDARRRSHQEAH